MKNITKGERNILRSGYYDIIQVTDNYIEIKSKNTKHYWILSKPMPLIDNKPIIIYHKHSKYISYYHKHGFAYNIYQAVNIIKSHDAYVLSGMGKYNKA